MADLTLPEPVASDVLDEVKATLEGVVAVSDAKVQTLIDQRDALVAQRKTLNEQLNALNAQIAAQETPETKNARLTQRFINELKSGRMRGPMGRM